MRLLSIVHQRDAGPGVFAEAVADAGARMDEWHVAEADRPPDDPLGYDAVMVFGGSMNVDDEDAYPWLTAEKALLRDLLAVRVPVLGVCLGAQLLSEAAGGSAHRAGEPEIGWYEIELTPEAAGDPVFAELPQRFEAFEWHSYACGLPEGAVICARTPVCAQAFRIGDAAWGIQFHAEVTLADALQWAADYRVDPDAVRLGIDPERLRAETEPRMEAWSELGRGLAGRFVGAAREVRSAAGARSG